jgi:UDP-3-O-[3-hydroxymyristoyl] glucosamine N-acyltransferase
MGGMNMLVISETAVISRLADIEDSKRGSKIIVEDGVHIDSFVKIKPTGGTGDVHIGRNSYVNSGVVIPATDCSSGRTS